MIKEHINKNAKIYVGGRWPRFTKKQNAKGKAYNTGINFAKDAQTQQAKQRKQNYAQEQQAKKDYKKSPQYEHNKRLGVNTQTASQVYIDRKLGELNRNQVRKHWYRGSETKKYTTEQLNEKRRDIIRHALGNHHSKGRNVFTKQFWTHRIPYTKGMWKTKSTTGKNGVSAAIQKADYKQNLAKRTEAYLNHRALSSGKVETKESKQADKIAYNATVGKFLEERIVHKETRLNNVQKKIATTTKQITDVLQKKHDIITKSHERNKELTLFKLGLHKMQVAKLPKSEINAAKQTLLGEIQTDKKIYNALSTKADRQKIKKYTRDLENKNWFGLKKRSLLGVAKQRIYHRNIVTGKKEQEDLKKTKKNIHDTRYGLIEYKAAVSQFNSKQESGPIIQKAFEKVRNASKRRLTSIQSAQSKIQNLSTKRALAKTYSGKAHAEFLQQLERQQAEYIKSGENALSKSMTALHPRTILKNVRKQYLEQNKADEVKQRESREKINVINAKINENMDDKQKLETANVASETQKLLLDAKLNLLLTQKSRTQNNSIKIATNEAILETKTQIARHQFIINTNELQIATITKIIEKDKKDKGPIVVAHHRITLDIEQKQTARAEALQKLKNAVFAEYTTQQQLKATEAKQVAEQQQEAKRSATTATLAKQTPQHTLTSITQQVPKLKEQKEYNNALELHKLKSQNTNIQQDITASEKILERINKDLHIASTNAQSRNGKKTINNNTLATNQKLLEEQRFYYNKIIKNNYNHQLIQNKLTGNALHITNPEHSLNNLNKKWHKLLVAQQT